MRLLVTGAAGFIGYHVCARLLNQGHWVEAIDDLNPYYDPALKQKRIKQLQTASTFRFTQIPLHHRSAFLGYFGDTKPERMIHLAAQAGVRYSVTHPFAYLDSNLSGFLNVLEACRANPVEHLVFASSSSVYGLNTQQPFSAERPSNHPVSLYAATKKSNELMAHAYSHLYGIPCTGLRFFTVYGPWGRPDMALFSFTKSILEGKEIEVYGEGKQKRDFTYIDDIVDGIVAVMKKPAEPKVGWTEDDLSSSKAPWRIYNIGNHQAVPLMDFIHALEDALGKKSKMKMRPMQLGDVPETLADIGPMSRDFGYSPKTDYWTGIAKFVEWYRSYYSV